VGCSCGGLFPTQAVGIIYFLDETMFSCHLVQLVSMLSDSH